MILARVKQNAEAYLGATVGKAIIVVPAYYEHFQRQQIMDAALVAGIVVITLMNGTTAVAFEYGAK